MYPVKTSMHGDSEKLSHINKPEGPISALTTFQFIEGLFQIKINNPSYFESALTHRSSLSRTGLLHRGSYYERLEFLGDAVLDLSIGHLLLEVYPSASEGDLSKMRAALVCTSALADLARELELTPFIRVGKGESLEGTTVRDSILADVIEAVFGAIYRDQGYDITLRVVKSVFGSRVSSVKPSDPKTELQELLHSLGKSSPVYHLTEIRGPEHAPEYVYLVKIDGLESGIGIGPSKKKSQQEAALVALKMFKKL